MLASGRISAHAHQGPAALEALAVEPKFEVTSAKCRVRGTRALIFPIAAIPYLNGAAAILSFGDRSFEIAIFERMVLDLYREALVMRIERRPFRYRL
jgi:hypothetical protein